MSDNDSDISATENELEAVAVLVEPAAPPINVNRDGWGGVDLSNLNRFCDLNYIERYNPYAIWAEFDRLSDSARNYKRLFYKSL